MRLNQEANHDKKWVELKSCATSGADTSVPLDSDLTNAVIATCKGPVPPPAANTTAAADGAGGAAAGGAATDAAADGEAAETTWTAKAPS